jgi:hypothetical protein
MVAVHLTKICFACWQKVHVPGIVTLGLGWSAGNCGLTRPRPADTFGEGGGFSGGRKDREIFSKCVRVLGRHEYFEKLRDVKLDSEDLGNGCMGNEAVT